MTVGLYFFLIGNHLVVGGISGLAVILQHFYPNFPISALMMVMNIILFIIAFVFIGKDFGGYTLFASFATSGYLWILETFISGHSNDHIQHTTQFNFWRWNCRGWDGNYFLLQCFDRGN